MCERLLRLQPVLKAMHGAGISPNSKAVHLTEFQWTVITLAEHLLKPFMAVQKELEGEKYVSVSFIPFMLARLRKGLEAAVVEQDRIVETKSRGFTRKDISKEAGEAADAAEAAETMLALALGMGMEFGGSAGPPADDIDAADGLDVVNLPPVDPAVLQEAELAIRETAKLMLNGFNDRFGTGAPVSECKVGGFLEWMRFVFGKVRENQCPKNVCPSHISGLFSRIRSRCIAPHCNMVAFKFRHFNPGDHRQLHRGQGQAHGGHPTKDTSRFYAGPALQEPSVRPPARPRSPLVDAAGRARHLHREDGAAQRGDGGGGADQCSHHGRHQRHRGRGSNPRGPGPISCCGERRH